MKDLPRLVDQIGGIYARATTETGGSQPQQVGRLWPRSAGAVAAGWISIYCRDFRSSLINSVVSLQFSHVLARSSQKSDSPNID